METMADQMEYNFELFTFGRSSDDTSNPDTLETKNLSVRLGKSSSSEKLVVVNSLASRLGKITSTKSSSEKLAVANSLALRLGACHKICDYQSRPKKVLAIFFVMKFIRILLHCFNCSR